MKSIDKLEAERAKTQLCEIENKIKLTNDKYFSGKVQQTIYKAQQKVEKAELGHEKHNQMFQNLTEKKTLGVI